MSNILVTVLLPMYREEPRHALESIKSIVNQTYTDLEIIIIFDDPLNVSLVDLIINNIHDERIDYLRNKENIGLPLSLNKGVAMAKGKYIVRMDGDDISLADRIEKQVAFMESNMDISLSGTYASIIDFDGNVIGEYKKPIDEKSVRDYLHFGSSVIHPSWIVKRKVFEQIGAYDDIVPAQDYAFLIKLCNSGHKVANLPLVLLKYRVLSDSISHKNGLKSIKTTNILRGTAQGKISFSDAIVMINRINVNSDSFFNSVILLRGRLLMKGKSSSIIKKLCFVSIAGLLSFLNKDIFLDSMNLIKVSRFNSK